jgi:secreted PhoX family phosphatase
MLPKGFSSRVVAQGGQPVSGTTYTWHTWSDGAATFGTGGGGWILVSNSEVPGGGGASAIRFDSDGDITDAYSILSDTSSNCAGGRTPWGTWLSCEEVDDGRVWECDPRGDEEAEVRPALGVFKHEAVAVDPKRGHLYLTEDLADGGFYRFTPETPGDLSEGLLEIANVDSEGRVKWKEVPDPSADPTPTRQQVPGSTQFHRGEGIWFDSGIVYLATTADNKIHAYDVERRKIKVLYDGSRFNQPPLTNPDNLTVSRSGDLYVCDNSKDGTPFDICIITPNRVISRFVKVTGPQHGDPNSDTVGSEPTGVAFSPSGKRLYFASQRAFVDGIVYEVKGSFRR